MAINSLTGSESARYDIIQNHWVVFEPISKYDKSIVYNLYSVPLGQNIEPTVIINTGSVTTDVSGVLSIEKEIHVFYDETLAGNFITEIGPENVLSIEERIVNDPIQGESSVIEVQIVNYSQIAVDLSLQNDLVEKGFFLEIYKSGSEGLRKAPREVRLDEFGNLISDTYLKYFEIKLNE